MRLPGGINGRLTVCPEITAKAPDLGPQLAAIQAAMGNQQAQLKELDRLVRSLNEVAKGLGIARQAELLKNIAARLDTASSVNAERLGARASILSTHFEETRRQVISLSSQQATAQSTATAVAGPLGDAIAHLDFDTVNEQLLDIQRTLGEVNKRTAEMQTTLNAMHEQQVQEARARQEQIVAGAKANAEAEKQVEEYKKKLQQQRQEMEAKRRQQEEERDARKEAQDAFVTNDPGHFVIFTGRAFSGSAPAGPWTIHVSLTNVGAPLTQVKLRMVPVTGRRNASELSLSVPPYFEHPGIIQAQLSIRDLPDQATFCFSGLDARFPQPRLWRQSFTFQHLGRIVTLEPLGPATLTADTASSCR